MMMNSKSSLCLLFLTWLSIVTASDRVCSDEGFDDICNCDLYKATNCVKPKYYYNGEGGSYKIKNWDDECAECCCITVQETQRTPPPTSSPTSSPSAPPTPSPTTNPTPGPTGWGSTWNGGSWSGGGGGGSKPKPKPKKPAQKPKIVQMLKPKPKPKAKPSSTSSGSGGSPSWNGNGGGWGSPVPTVAPTKSPEARRAPSTPSLAPIPTKSTPDSSPPIPVRTPPTAPKPTKPSYYYNAEGSSYKQKSASGAVSSMSQITSSIWAGAAVVGVALIGFIAGLHTGRRRRNIAGDDLIEDTRYERS